MNRSVTLNGGAIRVVGVLPANAAFPNTEAQLFLPLVIQANPDPPSRTSHQFTVYARLKPNVTFAQARAEMDHIGKDLESQYPQLSRGHGAHLTSLSEEITRSR